MLEKVVEEFNKYTDKFDKTNSRIKLKYNHSFAVMDLMGELAFRLELDNKKIELARVIGLLHDIGRFEQVAEFDSFNDEKIDHAEIGADYLFEDNHIRDFIDTNEYDSKIEKAIRNHNKLKIEGKLNKEEMLFAKMIRDMDKVDIYKQIAINNEPEFKASDITIEVLEKYKNENLIDKTSRKTKSDAVLLVLGFIYDINFNESFDILVETDNFDLYLSTVNVSEDSENLWKKVKELAFDKINRGV